jgi:hypothetical protein
MCALDYPEGLLLMAGKDFDAMRGMVGCPLFADEIFGFHAQQAIEKALKAWLAARGIERKARKARGRSCILSFHSPSPAPRKN